MLVRFALVLILAFCPTPGWSGAEPGQFDPRPESSGLLAIDRAAFEVATATGGFYYFWRPGEFSELASQDELDLFSPGERLIEQIDGTARGTIELPFEIHPDEAQVTVRVGLQSLGEIDLVAPGQSTPYTGGVATRTTHMLFVDLTNPMAGTWMVRLMGEGLFLVQVTGDRTKRASEATEPSASALPSGEAPGNSDPDLANFRRASSEERWEVLRRLPRARGNTLARALLHDSDPKVAYVAAGWLARQGYIDEAVPVYARIYVRGENESALHGRMGYDWIHDDDETLAQRILEALGQHLQEHLRDYSPAERKRAEAFLSERTASPPP